MPDLSGISNEQLMQMLGQQSPPANQVQQPEQSLAPQSLSGISDQDLMKALAQTNSNNLGPGFAAVSGFNANVPFGEKAQAAIGATMAAPFSPGHSWGDLYNQMRQEEQTTQQANPTAHGIGNAVGFVNNLPIASKLLGPAGEWANSNVLPEGGNLFSQGANAAARMGKGALVASPVGAFYGAGAAPDGQELAGAKQGALAGGFLGAATPMAVDALGSLNDTLGTKVIPTASDLRAQASQLYSKADSLGGNLTPQFTDKFISQVQDMAPQTNAGKILTGDSPFTQAVNKIQQLQGQPLTLQAAQEVDEALGNMIDSNTELGRLNKDGKKILDIQNAFRNSIENAGPGDIVGGQDGFDALSQARQFWSASRKMDDVERILTRAQYSQNPDTAIKNGFKTILSNPARLRGYDAATINAMQKAASTGLVEGSLKTIGSGLVRVAAPFLGLGPIGDAAVAGTSFLGKSLSGGIAAQKAENVASQIASRAVPNESTTLTQNIGDWLKRLGSSGASKQLINQTMLENSGVMQKSPEFYQTLARTKVADANGEPTPAFHGTGQAFQNMQPGMSWHSSSPEVAATYTNGPSPNIRQSYINLKNPVEIDANGANWSQLNPQMSVKTNNGNKNLGEFMGESGFDKNKTTNDIAKWAQQTGHDGVIFRNIIDRGPNVRFSNPNANKPADVYLSFSNDQLHSPFESRFWTKTNQPNKVK